MTEEGEASRISVFCLVMFMQCFAKPKKKNAPELTADERQSDDHLKTNLPCHRGDKNATFPAHESGRRRWRLRALLTDRGDRA